MCLTTQYLCMRGVMRRFERNNPNREIALRVLSEIGDLSYTVFTEHAGRFVSAYGGWMSDAARVGTAISFCYDCNRLFNIAEDLIMARKQQGNKKPQIEFEFVRGEMTADQKADAKTWIDKNSDDAVVLVSDMLASDYKYSLSYDDYNDTFICSITGKVGNAYNEGKILTGRGKSWWLALMSCLYKHQVIHKGKAWKSEAVNEDDFS